MRTLTYIATGADDGRTVLSLLRRELACSDSHISRLKKRDTGILLNQVRCYVTARVKAGDVLAVEIGDQVYWDGGYSGNPLIYPLIYQSRLCLRPSKILKTSIRFYLLC